MYSKNTQHIDQTCQKVCSLRQQFTISVCALTLGSAFVTQAVAETYIDAMILHTPGLSARYNGDATTRINHLVSVTNKIYEDSGLDVTLRPVHIKQVDYPENTDSGKALRDVRRSRTPGLEDVGALRNEYGADMVIMMRPYTRGQGSCGVAYVGGRGREGKLGGYRSLMYSHVSATTCGDYVTAHELGHNLGLSHSRAQGSKGTWDFSVGHGVEGEFTTVMAYQSAYNVNYWSGKIYKFSSPSLDCKGYPCGVDRNDPENGADAVYTLQQTAPVVEGFHPTTQPSEDPLQISLKAAEERYNEALERKLALRSERVESRKRFRESIIEMRNIITEFRAQQLTRDEAFSQWRAIATTASEELKVYRQIRKDLRQQNRVLRAARIALHEARNNIANA